MRAFRVDMKGIEEVDLPDDFDTITDYDWDCVRLGEGHDAWVRDDALFQPEVAVATIGAFPRVPLPAYILGAAGENTVDATMSLEDARGLVTDRTQVR